MFLDIVKFIAKPFFQKSFLIKICASASVCHIVYTYIVNPYVVIKYSRKHEEEIGLDYLQINRLLTFGISVEPCDCTGLDNFNCQNLDCNYGRLWYVLNFINKAEHSIDLCIYIITGKIFGDAILNAFKRGLRVRVIADSDMSFSAQSKINDFRYNEIPIRQRMSPYIMHHKFLIIDNKILLNGSMNFTMTGAFCNWENVMITTKPALVNKFIDAFQNLWDDFKPGNNQNDIKIVKKKIKNSVEHLES